jgi:uncharacterized Fe-S center protein
MAGIGLLNASNSSKSLPALVKKEHPNPIRQLHHAQKIGLGRIDYQLIEVD